MRNKDVVNAWAYGRDAKSYNGNLRSIDGRLYSYNLCIGILHDVGAVVLNVRGENFRSMTTSHHVGLAARYATELVEPVPDDSVNGYKWPTLYFYGIGQPGFLYDYLSPICASLDDLKSSVLDELRNQTDVWYWDSDVRIADKVETLYPIHQWKESEIIADGAIVAFVFHEFHTILEIGAYNV